MNPERNFDARFPHFLGPYTTTGTQLRPPSNHEYRALFVSQILGPIHRTKQLVTALMRSYPKIVRDVAVPRTSLLVSMAIDCIRRIFHVALNRRDGERVSIFASHLIRVPVPCSRWPPFVVSDRGLSASPFPAWVVVPTHLSTVPRAHERLDVKREKEGILDRLKRSVVKRAGVHARVFVSLM